MDAQKRGTRGSSRTAARVYIGTKGKRCVQLAAKLLPFAHSMPVEYRVPQANIFSILALDMPFMILPFRPTSDPSAARTFIRNFFDRGQALHGDCLTQELRLTEPMVKPIFRPLGDLH